MKAPTMTALALFVASGAAGAGDLESGEWLWNIDDPEAYYAATANSSGNVLMQMCDIASGNCMYLVGFDTTCKEGDKYPALVNSDVAAASIELHCGKAGKDGTNLMAVGDFDLIDSMIRKGTRIGFALPMQGDQFKAVRFSLKGAVPALDAMRKVASMSPKDRSDAKKVTDSDVF